MTGTDLDAHQNRFRIPSDGALGRLRPILTPDELDAASLLHDPAPRPRRQHQREPTELENVAADDDGEAQRQEQGKAARKKRQGRRHGGLPVRLVDLAAGASGELLLSRWESTAGTVVKGEGYMGFVRRCSFREDDAVEIWAFKQREVRLFGAAVCDESHLHLLIVKRGGSQQQCLYCPRQE